VCGEKVKGNEKFFKGAGAIILNFRAKFNSLILLSTDLKKEKTKEEKSLSIEHLNEP
jgi:hypothetical protein